MTHHANPITRHHVVLDMGFEAAVGALSSAIRDEALQVLTRADVRDHFWRNNAHDFRPYMLVYAWSPDLAFAALRDHLALGPWLPAAFAVYELADGETAIEVRAPVAPEAGDPAWGPDVPTSAEIADLAGAQVARVLERLRQRVGAREVPAA